MNGEGLNSKLQSQLVKQPLPVQSSSVCLCVWDGGRLGRGGCQASQKLLRGNYISVTNEYSLVVLYEIKSSIVFPKDDSIGSGITSLKTFYSSVYYNGLSTWTFSNYLLCVESSRKGK